MTGTTEAIIGRAAVMQAAQDTFISSTYWTEAVGPAAALATIKKLQRSDAPAHAARIGERFRAGWLELAAEHAVPARATGHPALLSLAFEHPQAAALGTLVTTRMLDRGFLLGGGFYPSLAHHERHVVVAEHANPDANSRALRPVVESVNELFLRILAHARDKPLRGVLHVRVAPLVQLCPVDIATFVRNRQIEHGARLRHAGSARGPEAADLDSAVADIDGDPTWPGG